jgi:hypothetical protein
MGLFLETEIRGIQSVQEMEGHGGKQDRLEDQEAKIRQR